MQLTRQHLGEQSYSSAVVAFAAFCAMTPWGHWRPAVTFTPLLSRLIHCMQLWLLEYCFQTVPAETACSSTRLEELLRIECDEFLVNTSHSPIGELSYWQLLAAKARNDINTHPVTTISPNKTVVCYREITLRLDDWRAGLQFLLV